MNKFTKNQEKLIIKEYLSGESANKLSIKYNCYDSTIRNLCKRNGIKLRNIRESCKRYKFDEKYFSFIDSSNKAYFLGLLYADGYNNEKSGGIEITLIEEDKYILEKFQDEINLHNKLYFKPLNSKNSNWNNVYKLSLTSHIMSKDLSSLGCMQRKSMILKFPEFIIDSKFLPNFILGYFDGDGTLSVSERTSKYKDKEYKFLGTSWSVVGTENFCNGLSKVLKDKLNINGSVIKTKNIYRYSITDRDNIIKLCFWLYTNSSIYLHRKYVKFISLLNYIMSNKDNSFIKNCSCFLQ